MNWPENTRPLPEESLYMWFQTLDCTKHKILNCTLVYEKKLPFTKDVEGAAELPHHCRSVLESWEICGSCFLGNKWELQVFIFIWFDQTSVDVLQVGTVFSPLGTASLLLVALLLLMSLCLDAWSVNCVTSRDLEEEGQCLPHGKDSAVLRMGVQYSCMSVVCLLGICGLSESGLCQAGFEWFLWKGTSSMEHVQNPLGRKISYKCFGKVLTHGQSLSRELQGWPT